MSVETSRVQPVFDPENVGASLDLLRAQIPIRRAQLSGLLMGEATSTRKGEGADFDGVREYARGDNPRYIDWNGTARQPDGTLLVREHMQDITPDLWVVTDTFRHRNSQNPGHFSELRLGASVVLSLVRLAEIQGMPFGVVASNDQNVALRNKRAEQGRPHVRSIAHRLSLLTLMAEVNGDAGEFSLADTLRFAGKQCTESVVAVVSDFRDALPEDNEHDWKQALRQLERKKNDIIAIELTNPWDFELPAHVSRFGTPSKHFRVASGKKGQQQRAAYAESALQQQAAIDDALAAVNALHIKLSTGEAGWLSSLRRQLNRRQENRRVA